MSCSRYVVHFHIVPTSAAACAKELLIVMTAIVLCLLVVTTRFVQVELPNRGVRYIARRSKYGENKIETHNKKRNEPKIPVILAPGDRVLTVSRNCGGRGARSQKSDDGKLGQHDSSCICNRTDKVGICLRQALVVRELED